MPLKVKTLQDEWTFIHDMSTLIIVYADAIEEWSLNSIERPVFLKSIPLMGATIRLPLVLDYTSQYLAIECTNDQLLIIKTGVSAISSVFMGLSIRSGAKFSLVATQQLLLFCESCDHHTV